MKRLEELQKKNPTPTLPEKGPNGRPVLKADPRAIAIDKAVDKLIDLRNQHVCEVMNEDFCNGDSPTPFIP